jgi:hypothetical protein
MANPVNPPPNAIPNVDPTQMAFMNPYLMGMNPYGLNLMNTPTMNYATGGGSMAAFH